MKKTRSTLQNKLILSYLAVALITVMVVSAFLFFSFGRSLVNLVTDQQTAELRDAVEAYYASNNSLNGFFEYYLRLGFIFQGQDQASESSTQTGSSQLRGVYGLVDAEYRAILPTLGYGIGELVPANELKHTISVKMDGQVIAWILPDLTPQFKLNPEEQRFLNRSTLAIGMASLAGVFAAIVMGFFLAGRLLKPITQLTEASQALGHGNLVQQVPVRSHDELGLLTDTFNRMSAGLNLADQQRKQMTADITHDLSTPIQIMSGYIEMLENQDVSLTPQRIEIFKTELEHLQRLVSDLTTLTQIENGGLEFHLQPWSPSLLLERIYQTYKPIAVEQGAQLILAAPPSPCSILVDDGRMMQVLKNLVDNALRYTPKGGRITLGAHCNDVVELRVTDSGSGIEAEDLPLVFDRFYRADKARGANSGKMGLGLAICKALVVAQGGSIAVESAGRDQGTAFTITFPRVRADPSQ